MSEFDPEAAAGKALGDLSDGDLGPDPDPDGGDGGGSDPTDAGDDGDDAISLTRYLRPLVFADERGPSERTFCEKGCSRRTALVLDGATDYVLDVIDEDPGETIGPLGKIGLGLSQDFSGMSSRSDDDGDGSDEEEETGGDTAAGAPGGVPKA